jgi:hypothetical protein
MSNNEFVLALNLLLTEASEIFFFAKKTKNIHFWMETNWDPNTSVTGGMPLAVQ